MSQKAFANVEDAVESVLGSDISETMAASPPDVDEFTDEDKVDEENLGAPNFSIHFEQRFPNFLHGPHC